MKIPFDIKYRPQIESGEYKVETFSGYPVTIYRWDFDDGEQTPIMGSYVFEDNKEYVGAWNEEGHFDLMSPNNLDLFIITPEPELSEFEVKVSEFAEAYELAATDCESEEYKTCNGNLQLIIDKYADELLELAKKELCEGGEITDWYAKGKAEALRTRATELTKNLTKSGLDTDSIPYHLIEFMCNLYTCKNWKEIEETAEAYATRIKAAAMKDLPRWKKIRDNGCIDADGDTYTDCLCLLKRGWYQVLSSGTKVCGELRYLSINDLEKLPGFNE